MPSKRLPIDAYVDGIRRGDRMMLSRAITLIESTLPADRPLATAVLQQLSPVPDNTFRLGITGVPGVGKSTFIEAFGGHLADNGRRVAVLSVDPTSQRTRGSILGDKTRMETLSHHPLAYVRPSPSGGAMGGVTNRTPEVIQLCEAAGFEVVIVETVGVGQSETTVKDMVDFFLLLVLPGAGDELQGIKRGIVEMADAVVINKADEHLRRAKVAQADYRNALHLFPPTESGWVPPVLTCSSLTKAGIPEIEAMTETYAALTQGNGFWAENRRQQRLQTMFRYIDTELGRRFYENTDVQNRLRELEPDVLAGNLQPAVAAESVLQQAAKSLN